MLTLSALAWSPL